MTDLSFDAAEISAAIKKNLEGFDSSIESGTVGRVLEVGDGIARVSGLPNVSVNEILEFESGDVGLALNLDADSIGAVILGDVENIAEGQNVKSTGGILSVPVGAAVRGEVGGSRTRVEVGCVREGPGGVHVARRIDRHRIAEFAAGAAEHGDRTVIRRPRTGW